MRRAKQANLKVYSPHKYRHGCFNHILPFIKSGDQLKALSQTFGHESIKTSLEHYGNFNDEDRIRILSTIRFDNDTQIVDVEKVVRELVSVIQKNNFVV